MEFRNLRSEWPEDLGDLVRQLADPRSQVEEDAALACVRRALDVGITTFDTADVYANTAAETVLGKALRASGERRWRSSPRSTADRARKHNDHGLSRKHILESIDGSFTRLGTDYVDLYQAHRYDHETPLEETMEAFADVVRSGKALYIGVSEWRAEEIRAAHALARELGPLVSNQPQYSMLWRVIEAEVVPTCEELGHRPGRLVADRAGRAHRQVPAGATARGLACHRREGRRRHDQALAPGRRPRARCSACSRSPTTPASPWPSSPSRGRCRTPTSPARSSAPPARSRSPTTPGRRVQLDDDVLKAIDDVVGDVVERDPEQTTSPPRPAVLQISLQIRF